MPAAQSPLNTFKTSSWRALNSFVHGIQPLSSMALSYSIELVIGTVRVTNALAV